MTTRQPLPIMLVAGFLGSGKTTLMRRLIGDARERNLRLSVVVNEFGAADVDSNILREADAELIASISGGCACCTGQDDFAETLLEIASRNEGQRPDVLLIEASGLADPVLLLDVMTAVPLLHLVQARSIISVIDSGRYIELLSGLGQLLRRQTQLADLIVLNKIDLVESAPLAKVEAHVRDLNGNAELVRAEQCAFDFAPLWESVLRSDGVLPPAVTGATTQGEGAAHAHYHTAICPLPHPVERARLEAALQELPPEVWRVKGFVRLRGESGVQLVQYTGGAGGGRFQIAPFYLPFAAEEPPTNLVFIGPALDREKLLDQFAGRGNRLSVI